MSFRLFVYYCALGGAWAGFIGWFFGAVLAPSGGVGYFGTVLRTSVQGMLLALVIALGLSFLDATFNVSLRQIGKVILRVFAAVFVGVFAGLFGSFIGGSLYYLAQKIETEAIQRIFSAIAFIFGWTIVGLLIGLSICFFELVTGLVTRKDFGGAFKKFVKCVIGGTIGGILGGVVASAAQFVGGVVFSGRDPNKLWTPTALGFIAIGACIGLLVGLAQIILKEAWIRVEAGFRPGREMLISKESTSIGRAEGSDIALFGDSGVEKTHANIVLEGGRYFLEDLQTPGGSYVNDQRVQGKTPLKTGDLIRVGRSVLRFNERAKRND
ncbi:MAG: FHA domain-containing protein [Planctomycetes bacterium]|nr:FHA domain-containing protein [Planctomycetota bacterium]